MTSRRILWLVPLLAYLAFAFWYTNTKGPLTAGEIESFTQRAIEAGQRPEDFAHIVAFMTSDTGRQFIMVNNIEFDENPADIAGADPGETATQLFARYTAFIFPQLARRASHPVYAGSAVHASIDLVGIEGAETWDRIVLMRYRSRRDLLDIFTNPTFAGRHEFKIAALSKTIAYPVEGNVYFSDLRFLLALILIALVALLDIALFGRRR